MAEPTVDPTIEPSTGAPSSASSTTSVQTAVAPLTKSPFEENSNAIVEGKTIQATPFSVTYTLDTMDDPSKNNFDEVADLTITYLQSFVADFFGQNQYQLIRVSGNQIANTGTGDPATIGFEIVAVFSEESEIMPTQADIDVTIDSALSEPEVDNLIDQLKVLEVENPFFNTANITYTNISRPASDSTQASNDKSSNDSHVSGVVIGALAALLILITAGILVVVRHRRKAQWQGKEGEEGQMAAKGRASSDFVTPSSTGARTVCSGAPDIDSSEENAFETIDIDGVSLFESANAVD
jgi:hypothetical protein